jgi:hypothetical protein
MTEAVWTVPCSAWGGEGDSCEVGGGDGGGAGDNGLATVEETVTCGYMYSALQRVGGGRWRR